MRNVLFISYFVAGKFIPTENQHQHTSPTAATDLQILAGIRNFLSDVLVILNCNYAQRQLGSLIGYFKRFICNLQQKLHI
ncbi:hypothetical protein T02_6147 [Trichinella nativa]|uniref:Uncharacterized protein n=1 Tax=Trichinella nativa TaxID=6335 RepID=A0A0V1KX63_9BILA|nr:hypothetical protein T02_6147 [Trichinella nativa]